MRCMCIFIAYVNKRKNNRICLPLRLIIQKDRISGLKSLKPYKLSLLSIKMGIFLVYTTLNYTKFPFCIIVPISQICSFCPNGAMRKGCCHPFGMYSTISSSGGQRSRWTLRAIDSTLPLLVVAGHQGCHHHCASPTSLFVNLWIWNKCFFGAFWVAKVQTGSGKMAVVNLWTLPH